MKSNRAKYQIAQSINGTLTKVAECATKTQAIETATDLRIAGNLATFVLPISITISEPISACGCTAQILGM